MKKYGLEFEFFVSKGNEIIPAYKATNNLDGDPVIGELRTGIHDTIISAIYELKKLIYIEKKELSSKGFNMVIVPVINFPKETIKSLHTDSRFIDLKMREPLTLYSIYGKKTSNLLSRTIYKASLQINISENKIIYYKEYTSVRSFTRNEVSFSTIFDYVSEIRKYDLLFKEEIKDSKRIPGVYSIKSGGLGDRVEYRSLPNNISFEKLMS